MTANAKAFTFFMLLAATAGCDRATKHLAQRTLAGEPRRSYLADTVRLDYTENRGGFLGLGAGLPDGVRTTVFTVGTVATLGALSSMMFRHLAASWSLVGLSLIWAGGVSNLIDRLARGSVVDFLNVGVGPLRTGIFNVADLAITTGVALMLLGMRSAHRHGR